MGDVMGGALGFLTVLGRSNRPDGRAIAWFPVIGLLLGVGVGLVWWGTSELWPPVVSAGLVVAADVALTGALHFDGLVDTADGILPPLRDRATRLAVMRTPDVGAFGLAAGILVLGSRWAGLAVRSADVMLVAGLWCLSRSGLVAVVALVPYAREEGLATAFLDGRGAAAAAAAAGGAAAACTLILLAEGLPGVATISAAVVAGIGVVWLAARRVGGYTGDVLGATLMVAETAGLVVAGARW